MSGGPRSVLGVDMVQWRILLWTYLRVDVRAGSGASSGHHQIRSRLSGILPYMGVLLLTLAGSSLLAFVVTRIPDTLAAVSFVVTYGAMTTGLLVLVEFTALVVSPNDYAVLGPRPVTSRTYFAARLATVLTYISVLSLTIAVPPAVTFGWRGLGLAGYAGVTAAVLLCNVAATVIVINAYVLALNVVHPGRLRRTMSVMQLLSAVLFYGVFYAASSGGARRALTRVSFEAMPWLWANPASWFAAWVPVVGGTAGRTEWFAAAAALAMAAAAVPLAAGALSLDYARKIGEMMAVAEPPRRASRALALPGFGRGEARAVAVLVRAQFRYDNRFRLSVLAVVPLIVFYVLLGVDDGALRDPFTSGRVGGGAPLYMAVVFIPMTLHSSLHLSESWRAAWIFLATPASAVRLVLAAKNFAAVVFLGSYLLLLAGLWCFFFDSAWHAFFHALMLGLVAHLLLQIAVFVHPALPFATEPRRAEQSVQLFAIFLFGGIAAGLLSALLPVVYGVSTLTIVLLVLLLAATAMMEVALRKRLASKMDGIEFAS